ncbi:serine hydrolase-domain-containing protein [Chaetomium sp. MPI-CAGE-AT-0009]|nr:serine hydrolase-domain-containing protein [Chaetomium sp. MPI-CAGE-AT-0009]
MTAEPTTGHWIYDITETLIIDSTTPPLTLTKPPMSKTPEPKFNIPKDIPEKKFRILMLHGYTQNARLFALKTVKIHKKLARAFKPLGLEVELIYPTAPNLIGLEVEQQYAWYSKRSPEHGGGYVDLDKGMNHIADVFRETRRRAREEDGDEEGGIDCVLGFSQGACVAGMLMGALESVHKPRAATERVHQGWLDNIRDANEHRPLKFAVLYGGFIAEPLPLEWLYNPKIVTPCLHVIGSLDTVVLEEVTRKLAAKCINSQITIHDGGHHVRHDKWFTPVLQYFLDQVSPKPTDTETDADTA